MTTELEGFGQPRKLDPELAEVKAVLEVGIEYKGEGVLSQLEEDFCQSCYHGIVRQGDKWDYSDARREVVKKIERKLEGEGLL